MLFSKDLDKSLYFILKKDKQNRNDIIKFLNSIPKDLYIDVQNSIKTGDIRKLVEKDYINNDNNAIYVVKCFSDLSMLTICEVEGINYNDTTELTLNKFDLKNGQLGHFIKYNETSYLNENKEIVESTQIDYEIIENNFTQSFLKTIYEEEKEVQTKKLCNVYNPINELTLEKLNKKNKL